MGTVIRARVEDRAGNLSNFVSLKNSDESVFSFYPTDTNDEVQTWVCPKSGSYKIQVWGGDGGDVTHGSTIHGGYTGYACKTATFTEGQTVALIVGKGGIDVPSDSGNVTVSKYAGSCYMIVGTEFVQLQGGGGGLSVLFPRYPSVNGYDLSSPVDALFGNIIVGRRYGSKLL